MKISKDHFKQTTKSAKLFIEISKEYKHADMLSSLT